MKYWAGYLTAAILGAISWVLLQFGEKFTVLVDMVYPYVTRTVMDMLAVWTAPLNFCLWQVVVVAAAVVLLAVVVLMIVLRLNPVRWIGWALAVCSLVYMLHTLVFGLNYYAGDLSDDIRMDNRQYTVEELTSAATYYRDMANLLAVQVDRDSNGDVAFAEFEQLAIQAEDGFDTLVHEYSYPVFAGNTMPVKKLGWADMYSSMGITGVTMGLTGEAAVNPQIPDVTLPFTMCHEMAHRMSIATERDANFAAFLACRFNSSVEYQYSAYFMAYKYCCNALVAVGGTEARDMAARIRAEESELLRRDLVAYDQFFAVKRNDQATKVADTVNDTYIKTSGDEAGILSYGQVSDYLVNWYIQEIVAPTQVEVEQKFDPYDENQVDLSGLHHSPTEETQGDEEE